jgi:outer membrane protein OmpA-like peptidoglycan-associated protein
MLRRLLPFLIFTISCANVFAQADVDAVKLADEMYGFGDKRDALDVYVQASVLNPKNARAFYMAGKCYQETIEKGKSVKYLEKAYKINPIIANDILYLIGKGYQYDAKFEKAIENFNLYKTSPAVSGAENKSELIKKADKHIQECENGKIFYSQQATKELVNIGPVVNSEYAEYSPVISADESMLIFTSRRQGTTGNRKDVDNEFFEDIYVSKKTETGTWGRPENIGTTINTEFHEACNGISNDGKELYIFRETHGGDIYKCVQKADGNWSSPERMEHINTKHEEASITFSGDGKMMIFSSDRPGGIGRLDLYFCTKNDKGEWSAPQNIGTTINTQYDEDSPFLNNDATTLFFSSAGFNTMGGYDIFKSTFVDGKWTEPVNMGYPINTTDDDIYYVESGDGIHGYYASVRSDGSGEKDIYMITNAKPKEDTIAKLVASKIDSIVTDSTVEIANSINDKTAENTDNLVSSKEATSKEYKSITLKGRVFDAASGDPIEANIDIFDESGKKIKQVKTSPEGYYSLVLNEKKARHYKLTTQPSGFVKKSIISDLTPSLEESEVVRDFSMSKYVTGKKYILRNIYFDFNQATIKPESNPELKVLKEMLEASPNMKIEIGGHTDYVGTAEYNKILSQKRAQAVVNYLIHQGGISPDRIRAVGYGKEHPLASNDDENEGRELNRRTEFKVL